MKRRIALALSMLALLGGGTAAALAAAGGSSRHHHSRPSTLAVAAGYLGISTDQLSHDVRAGKTLGEVASSTPGHSEAGLVAAILASRKSRPRGREAKLAQRIVALVNGTAAKRASHKRRHHAVRGAVLSYLGLSARELHGRLRGGKTLAEVADSTAGKSSAGLAAAIESAREARITQAAASGAISQKAGSARSQNVASRVRTLLDRPHPAHRRH